MFIIMVEIQTVVYSKLRSTRQKAHRMGALRIVYGVNTTHTTTLAENPVKMARGYTVFLCRG